jgi:hypothetical protein
MTRALHCICLILVGLVFSCEDIILPNLSEEGVALTAPADSAVSVVATQIFIWEAVTGASQYRLTIYSPDVRTANAVVLDTTIKTTSFTYKLAPAAYEWCVKAGNGTDVTAASCRKIEIKTTLASAKIILRAPADDLKTVDSVHTFWWSEVKGASTYNLIVVSPDLSDVAAIVKDTVIASTSLVLELSVNKYEWCVTASDDQHTTDASCRKLEVAKK